MQQTNTTNDSPTFGSSVGGLIAFAAICWIFILSELAGLWYLIWWHRQFSRGNWARKFPLVTGCQASSKTTYARVVTGVIVIGMIVALLSLVVGGVLSSQNGNSSDTAGLSAEGVTGRVLLILSTIIQLLVWTVMLAAVTHNILGCTYMGACAITLGCVFEAIFLIVVAFLGWSSFESDKGSISTATAGPSVVELIIFAALSWGATLPTPVITWFIIREKYRDSDTDTNRKNASKFSVVPSIVIGIPPLLLVAGSVLSLLNAGDSTNTSGLSAEDITGRVLLILSEVISLLVWVVLFTVTACILSDTKRKFHCCTTLGCLLTTVFVIGVTLVGWSSFEFDAVQINGSNSTFTPGLHTAGVVISSLGIGVPVLLSVILFCSCCNFACVQLILKFKDDAKNRLTKVQRRRQKTTETLDTRLRKSKLLLEEALKYGFVECRTVVCLLVGVAGAGKTHTKHLLFRWAPPDHRNSTPLAARPVHAIRVLASTEDGPLQEVDPDQLEKRLASTVAKGDIPLEKRAFFQHLCCIRKNAKKKFRSAGISPLSKSPHSHSIIENKSTSHRNWCCYCYTNDGPDSELQQTANLALDETAHQIANISGTATQRLLDGDWIYLTDCGGQIEFFEVLPAFFQHTSVCLFVTNLSEMLNERPKIVYFVNGQPVGEPTLCPFTNEKMLMRCVQTIQSQCIDQEGSTNQGSQLVMVGTHRDLEYTCSESREEKNLRLRKKLCPDFDQSLAFRGPKMEELIFPINAKNPTSQDYEVASEITEVIFNIASNLKPRKTPISWFKFEQHLQKLAKNPDQKILQRSECLQVARSLHLLEEDLDAALDHLASFGVIQYYPHLLPNVVFVDPQVILSMISELVKYHYQLRHEVDLNKLRYEADPNKLRYEADPNKLRYEAYPNKLRYEAYPSKLRYKLDANTLRKFLNEGCITLKLLEHFQKHYTNFFKPADFLKLMNDRLIITHLISGSEYFMPSLLRVMEPQEINQYQVTAFGVAPLAIHFSCKLVPHGVFCSLLAFLRSQSWKLSPCPEDNTKPLCLTRNCIKFQLPEGDPGSLTLIDAFSHFEVYVSARHDVCVRLCPSIWQTLIKGIHKAADTLKYSKLVPKQAFLCKHDRTQLHLALPNNTFNYWTCQENPDVSGPLTDEHKVWKGIPESTQSVQHVSGAKVMSKQDLAKCQAFQQCFAVLCNGISDPGWLATQLYSRDMISRDMRQEAELETLPAATRTRKLLSAVENQIITSPTPKFSDFLYILHSEPSLDHLGKLLEEACYPKEGVLKPVMETDSGVYGGAATEEEPQPKPVSKHPRIQAPTTQVQVVPEVPFVPSEGCPTVLECIMFQGKERTINIPQEIGSNYYYFGNFLLNDPNGIRVQNIEHKYRNNPLEINTEILQEWATGRGKMPVSWKTLTEVLHKIQLHTLATEIEHKISIETIV